MKEISLYAFLDFDYLQDWNYRKIKNHVLMCFGYPFQEFSGDLKDFKGISNF